MPNGVDAIARFLATITVDSTVTIDAPATVGSLQFDNTHRYTLAGPATLTLSSTTTAEIKLTSGDHTVARALCITSMPYLSLVNSAIDPITISGFFFANSNPFSSMPSSYPTNSRK